MADEFKIKTSGGVAAAETADEAVGQINREFEEQSVAEKARELGLSYVNIEATPINPDLLYLIEPEDAKNGKMMPFFRIGKKVRVAVVDPENPKTKEVVKKLQDQGYMLNLNLASEHGLKKALSAYESQQYHVEKETDNVVKETELQAYEHEIENLAALKEKFTDITSEEALNYINVGAIKTGASDIHFQPEEKDVSVRFRIDGVLQNIFRVDKKIFENIANQLKYKAKLKLNIDNVPQDGRFSFVINQRKIDVRVSSLPTEYGETFVCRLLDQKRSNFDFKELGFTGQNFERAKELVGLPNGLILVTGPTGSGKTTTLYSLLDKYNTPETKIITLEDPIEYHLESVSQSQINEKRGYDFAGGLRAILRQDPDVVMIGEVRDLETAQTAAQASLTGHVVLSTLHTNSAVESIPRLINMGLQPFMLAPALHTVVAQRLVRRICKDCAEEKPFPKSEMDEIQATLRTMQEIDPSLEAKVPQNGLIPKGCDKCSHTGYSGQLALVEVFQVDNEIKELILEEVSAAKLFAAARKKKMLMMKEDGIFKVLNKETTLTEVHRVTSS